MNKLDKWYRNISSFKKFNINEAKELYTQAINSNDLTIRKSYMDEVILGTLYVVYEYLKNNKIEILSSTSFDMDDIISSFCEVWIGKIKKGELLNVERFSNIFTIAFFSEVYMNLCNEEIIIKGQYNVSTECFVDLLILYIFFKNNNIEFNVDVFLKEYKKYNPYNMYSTKYIENLIIIFEKIYNRLSKNNEQEIELARTKIYEFIRIIINIGMFDKINDNFIDNTDYEEEIINNYCYKEFISRVDEILKDDRMRGIIHKRYGLDNNEPMTLEGVSNNYNITKERVRQIEAKAFRYLRRDEKLQGYRGI